MWTGKKEICISFAKLPNYLQVLWQVLAFPHHSTFPLSWARPIVKEMRTRCLSAMWHTKDVAIIFVQKLGFSVKVRDWNLWYRTLLRIPLDLQLTCPPNWALQWHIPRIHMPLNILLIDVPDEAHCHGPTTHKLEKGLSYFIGLKCIVPDWGFTVWHTGAHTRKS